MISDSTAATASAERGPAVEQRHLAEDLPCLDQIVDHLGARIRRGDDLDTPRGDEHHLATPVLLHEDQPATRIGCDGGPAS